MPSEFGPGEAAGDLRVSVAPVLELQFGLFLLRKHCIDPEKWVPEWVRDVHREQPGLVGRLETFWVAPGLDELEGQPYRECGELLVAGYRSGTVFANSVSSFVDALDPTFAAAPGVPALPSEPPGVVDLIARRVALLGRDARLRESLVNLVRELFAVIEPYWQKFGQSDAERSARDIAARARAGADLRLLLPGNSFVHKDAYQAHIAAARERNELVVVPLGLAGGGQFYWAFPGLVIVGVGVESADREARRKERAEMTAARMKVLSDPTRVGILMELVRPSHHAATVTELASQFGLSQPTVSVHLKILREAGLARPERDGNQVRYASDEATVRSFVAAALDDSLGADTR
ncbi:metalloregulator ArsR/SmtB family transcription factor [Candidatus Amarobacter glycogenicus]|uniref:ArsR/SmtB family transcription factor n=1 Tax=Candidatus Amarobacter glycogenicus TaxID=3140699 RepID=UPI003136C1BD|nr:winged helix-turn-helix transcriptional regulator [Dehalococcoidia bacterium]